MVIDSCSFTDNLVYGNNAMVSVSGVDGFTFSQNLVAHNSIVDPLAAFLYMRNAEASTFHLASTTFTDNLVTARDPDAACYLLVDAGLFCPSLVVYVGSIGNQLLLESTAFINNDLTPLGGLIKSYSGPVTYQQCQVSGTAGGQGNLIANSAVITSSFIGCSFTSNRDCEALTVDYYTTSSYNNCTWHGNVHNAMLYHAWASTTTIQAGSLVGNVVGSEEERGGTGLSIQKQSSLRLVGTEFVGNKLGGDATAILVAGGSQASLSHLTVYNHSLANHASIISTLQGSTTTIESSYLATNTGAGPFSAMILLDPNTYTTIASTTFHGNTFDMGIINVRDHSGLNVSSSYFLNNTARNSCGVASINGTAHFVDSSFIRNHAEGQGGALCIASHGVVSVEEGVFTGKQYGGGGGGGGL